MKVSLVQLWSIISLGALVNNHELKIINHINMQSENTALQIAIHDLLNKL